MSGRHLSPESRGENLERMAAAGGGQDPPLDILVIGGGITGAGVARDAGHRGLRVGIVERRDFAAGTSSRSSKLIHGGVRYLQMGDFGLVRESATERRILGHIAPHVVRPMRMVVPAHGRRSYLALNVGLWTYDKVGSTDESERYTMWSREETLAQVPQLRPERVYGAVAYWESATDDARLVLETLKDAHAAGALVANYAEVTALHTEQGRVVGARVHDSIAGTDVDVAARVVINAAGPWVDAVRQLEGPLPSKRLHLSKGIHLTLPWRCIPVEHIVAFSARDRRTVFVAPRGPVVYVGTTDTSYGEPTDYPEITTDDVHYLLEAAARAFSTPGITRENVVSAWAGLRPLLHEEGKAPSEISRKDEIMVGESGLLSIAGGKLTTYRPMAERIVDLAIETLERQGVLPASLGKCQTDRLPLAGGDFSPGSLQQLEQTLVQRHPAVPTATIAALLATYGTQCETVLAPLAEHPELAEPVAPGTALLRAEVRYAIEHEMALGVEDTLERRTRSLLFAEDQGLGAVDAVAAMLTERLGWTATRRQADATAYRVLAASLRPKKSAAGATSEPPTASRSA